MRHKRIHIRVPIAGKAKLSCKDGVFIQATTIDISAGGICIANPTFSLENTEYDVEVVTIDHRILQFKAVYVQESNKGVGLKIVDIDSINLKAIFNEIASFQATEEFINHIDEQDILQDWFLDDKGAELNITFQVV